jgi:glycyl-tRNA synthetase (class II)
VLSMSAASATRNAISSIEPTMPTKRVLMQNANTCYPKTSDSMILLLDLTVQLSPIAIIVFPGMTLIP